MNEIKIRPVAKIKNGFNEKFGVPRQSGLAPSVKSEIVFESEFRDENMIRGIEQYSHLWLIWGFSENEQKWSPTVRPPKLGGNKRVGVFATRSPFRPNSLGLSVVKLEEVKSTANGKILVVSGADLKMIHRFLILSHIFPMLSLFLMQMGDFQTNIKTK